MLIESVDVVKSVDCPKGYVCLPFEDALEMRIMQRELEAFYTICPKGPSHCNKGKRIGLGCAGPFGLTFEGTLDSLEIGQQLAIACGLDFRF